MTCASRKKTPAPRHSRTGLVIGPTDVGVIVGKRGNGKSTEGKRIAEDALDDGWRVVAWDPHREWSRHGRASEHVRLGPLDDQTTWPELLVRSRRTDKVHPLDFEDLSLAVVPGGKLPRQVADDFEPFVSMVESTGDLLLMVEEVGYFGKHCAEWLDYLATQSRHWGVPVVFLAQRLTQVPKTARTQASWVVSFRQDDDDDLEALGELVRDRTRPEFARQFADDVGALAPGEFRLWHERMRRHGPTPKEK
jgi:hypothetical protein